MFDGKGLVGGAGREQAVAAGVGVDKGVMRQRRAKSESNILDLLLRGTPDSKSSKR